MALVESVSERHHNDEADGSFDQRDFDCACWIAPPQMFVDPFEAGTELALFGADSAGFGASYGEDGERTEL